MKGGAAVAGGMNDEAVAGAGVGTVVCVEMDVGMVEPHVVSFEGT